MLLLSLLIVGVAAHASSSSSSSSSSHDGPQPDQYAHAEPKFVKAWEKYDDLKSSKLEQLRNEPFYNARMIQPKTKKWIKEHLNMTKAYCDGVTAKRCRLLVCHATSAIVSSGQFGDHVTHTSACPKKFKNSDLDVSKSDRKKNPELEWIHPTNPLGVLLMLKDHASMARKFCKKTTHTTDDRCKAQVECLTLGALTSAWPDLFKLKGCTTAELKANEDKHAVKLKHITPDEYSDFARLAHRAKNGKDLKADDIPTVSEFEAEKAAKLAKVKAQAIANGHEWDSSSEEVTRSSASHSDSSVSFGNN